MYLFGDDCVNLFEDNSWGRFVDKAASDFDKVKILFDQNYLIINVSDSKFMPKSLRDPGDITYMWGLYKSNL